MPPNEEPTEFTLEGIQSELQGNISENSSRGLIGVFQGKLVFILGLSKRTIQRIKKQKKEHRATSTANVYLRVFASTDLLREYLGYGDKSFGTMERGDQLGPEGETQRKMHRGELSEEDIEMKIVDLNPDDFLDVDELKISPGKRPS